MSNILNRIRDVDSNDSDAVKDAVSVFFSNLPNYTETDSNRWLRALENVINRFPKFCGSHRPIIEKYLAHFLDSSSYHNVIEAAKCAHVLQQVKPSQDKAATPKACWREQMLLLCNSAHSLIETLFSNSININKKSGNSQRQDTQILSNTPLTTALQNINKVNKTDADISQSKKETISIRLKNVLVFIQAMLVGIYPVAKPIRPQLVLEVILQAVSVSDGSNKKSLDYIVDVKTEALRTLDALVACLGANLVPFSALVFRFVMQTLRWSSESNSEQFKKVRCAAYSSLVRWLRVLHVHKPSHEGRGKLWEDELTEHIIADITPPKQVIELNVNAAIPTKNLSKKAKRKLANQMLQESSIAVHMPGEKNKINVSEEISDEVAIAALECAEMLLMACGIFLKPATHKVFQERLVRECFCIELYSDERASCLLRALEMARKSVPAGVPPPTQYCLQLYTQLLNHHSDISRFCSQALLDIRLQLHCSPPSLNFALEIQPEMKNRAEKKRNTISKRNREVLQSLLGAERMPSEAMEDDVISIPDEPSSKKPRQEFETDQISLSSASVESLDGSYASDVADNIEDTESVAKSVTSVEQNNYQTEAVLEIIPQDDTEVSRDVTDRIESDVIEVVEGGAESIPSNDEETSEHVQPIICESVQPNVDDAKEVVTQVNDLQENTETPVVNKAETNIIDTEKEPSVVICTNDKAITKGNSNEIQGTVMEIDESLPNTDGTDDCELTCGQVCQSSQEIIQSIEEVEQKKDEENKLGDEVPKENGIQSSAEKILENGDINVEAKSVPSKTVEKSGDLTVEDMLADFVDEVVEDNKAET